MNMQETPQENCITEMERGMMSVHKQIVDNKKGTRKVGQNIRSKTVNICKYETKK